MRNAIAIGLLSVVGAALAAALAATGVASGAFVKVGDLTLRANGAFLPKDLPRLRYAPITLRGHANIARTDRGVPPALTHVAVAFGPDGRVNTRGLARCAPERVEGVRQGVARRRCRGAIVGTGAVEVVAIPPGEQRTVVREPLTIFNGPRQGGAPTVVFHTHTSIGRPQSYVISAPLLGNGRRGFRVAAEVPPIADGNAAISHASIRIGRRFGPGRKRSYTLGRCRRGVLDLHGRLTFDNGVVIDGSVFRPCDVRVNRRGGRR